MQPKWQRLSTDIDPLREYTSEELEAIADSLLKWDALRTYCPTCEEIELSAKDAIPSCPSGHTWIRKDAEKKGVKHSPHQVLLLDAYKYRVEKEVYCTNGVPEPELYSDRLYEYQDPYAHLFE